MLSFARHLLRPFAFGAVAFAMQASIAAPILVPTEPWGRVGTYTVTENTYPHFGLLISSAGVSFPTDPAPPFSAVLDPIMGYPDLTQNGPWVFDAKLGFEVVSGFWWWSPDEQTVRVSGSVQHRDGGPVFSFDLISRATDTAPDCDSSGPIAHKDGTDTFQACLNAQRLVGDVSKLMSWDANVNAWHVTTPIPEPSVWLMMLSSLGVVGWAHRRTKRAD
jgi:hypothetical protein